MPPTAIPTDLTCASTACGRPLGVAGRMWVHMDGDNGWTRACATGASATPPRVPVSRYDHGDAGESWHAMWIAIEFVIWYHEARGTYSAWRVAMIDEIGVVLQVDAHGVEAWEPLVAAMPPVVAYWLREAIEPF